MSEVVKPADTTPVPAAVAATDPTTIPSTTPAAATTEATPAADAITAATETAPVAAREETSAPKHDAKVEATPASDGILGYKGPGLIQSLRFSKRFFWFSDEAFKSDTLDSYLRAEKAEIAHPNAAWAHETGKGLLFFAKRAEDKTAPTGILNLSEITDVHKDGSNDFSFKVHGHKHAFQAPSTTERDSWLSAIEAKSTEAQGLKDTLVGSEGYKKHVERYNKLGVGAATTATTLPSLSKSKERKDTSAPPRKSTDTKIKEVVKKDKPETGSTSSSDAERREQKSKSRSQSRKRSSIFGLLGNKKEELEEKKEVKKEEKAEEKAEKKHEKAIAKEHHVHDKEVAQHEKKHEKEVAKEEKKVEKDAKQADAKATHAPSDVAEAGAATVAPAVPAAVVASEKKTTEDPKTEPSAAATTTTKNAENHEKRGGGKRNSIFGISLFGGKKDVISPAAEKSESDVAPVVPAKDNEVVPVAETAPKIDEPIQNKPIDAAAVTAPIDSANASHDHPVDSVHAQTTSSPATNKTPTTPSHKGGVMGFFKRQDSKLEPKKEAKTEEPVTVPSTTAADTTAVTETPVAAAPTEERPTVDKKRRTSLFNSFGTIKDKLSSEATPDTDVAKGESKKSPIPQKINGLFRRSSKAVKSDNLHTEPVSAATEATPAAETTQGEAAAVSKDEPALTNGTTEAPKETTERVSETIPSAAPEVKASA